MAAKPNNPFDFTGALDLQEIFSDKTKRTIRRLEIQGMRTDKVYDLFYDALEAPGVDARLREQAIEVCERGASKLAQDICSGMFKSGLGAKEVIERLRTTRPEALIDLFSDTQRVSQDAIRIVRIKGEGATHPLLREIAREASTLSETERGNFVSILEALRKAHQRMLNPLQPESGQVPAVRRRPTGKTRRFLL